MSFFQRAREFINEIIFEYECGKLFKEMFPNIKGRKPLLKETYLNNSEIIEIGIESNSPILFKDLIIKNTTIKVKVISVNEDYTLANIKILKCQDAYFQRYVDVGSIYPLQRHTHWNDDAPVEKFQIWEIPSESMKRDVSQFLLYFEEGIGFTFDLDM